MVTTDPRVRPASAAYCCALAWASPKARALAVLPGAAMSCSAGVSPWTRTASPGDTPAAVPDRVNRDFTAAEPGTRLVGDIT